MGTWALGMRRVGGMASRLPQVYSKGPSTICVLLGGEGVLV